MSHVDLALDLAIFEADDFLATSANNEAEGFGVVFVGVVGINGIIVATAGHKKDKNEHTNIYYIIAHFSVLQI